MNNAYLTNTQLEAGVDLFSEPLGSAPAAATGTAPATLLDVFARSVARWPRNIALEAPDATYTYAELDEAANDLALRLNAAGIGRGDRVAVRVGSGTAELYLAILGVLQSGAAYVPIDADDPPARVADISRRSGARAILTDGLQLQPLGDGVGVGAPEELADEELDAWIIFTSGSTGAPKGVAVTHRSAAAFVAAEARLWTVEPTDRVLAGLSVGFDASCEEIWLAWANGAALVPAPRAVVRAGVELGTWLLDRGITVVSTVPTLAALWDESCLHGVRLLILGGEACPEPLGWRLSAGREVWNTYGPTEATVVSTAAPVIPGEPITIGWPLHGWEVAIVDEGEEVEPGEPGELVIGGIGLARYLDPALERERYAGLPALGWDRAYRTGDIVRLGPAGLEFVGRRDDQVKLGGRRIELGEVEAALHSAQGVVAAAVAVRETAAGNRLLVGYVVGEATPEEVRTHAAKRLPAGIVPLVVSVAELPMTGSGKVDRRALPWPLESDADALAAGIGADGSTLAEDEVWLAERWVEQLGPVAITANSDFFALGGTSLAAAKLISELRRRHPAVAVADLYQQPTLRTLAARLRAIGVAEQAEVRAPAAARTFSRVLQLFAFLSLFLIQTPAWLAGILAFEHWYHVGPQVPWVWIVVGWLALATTPAHSLIALVSRRLLMRGITPGRYPRNGSVGFRLLLLERISDLCRLEGLAGTPWAARYARLSGHDVARDAALDTLPPITSLVHVGAGVTIESEVDLHGWWVEGDELVIGELHIGDGARIGARALLMPDAVIEPGAEVEPGGVVSGRVPRGERWGGAPARRLGTAGEHWPAEPAAAPDPRRARAWRLAFIGGSLLSIVLPLLAALPGIVILLLVEPQVNDTMQLVLAFIYLAPLEALLFVVCFSLLVALAMRVFSRLIEPGWHAGPGRTGWALWMTGNLMGQTRGALFPLYSSSFTRRWLRLCGIPVGERTEVSIAVGINKLTSLGEASFAADDVVFHCSRARNGWLRVEPVSVGDRSFLGNSALLTPGTQVGDGSLVGLMTVAPQDTPDGSSWLGAPALELPRRPQQVDPRRTVDPPRHLRLARRCFDVVRILFPTSVAIVLSALAYRAIELAGRDFGLLAMVALTPLVLVGVGVGATLVTVLVKWLLMGRYRAGDHPFFSSYVWRDEIVNTCQEQLAGGLLMNLLLGTVAMPLYLRLMGARVGRDVWVENLNTTEFDLASFGDGAAVNRGAVIETHLFHDRVMSTGPVHVGVGATLGPSSVSLPQTVIGDGTVVGGRSIVMRGEQLPAGTRWHGAPVSSE